MANDDSVTIEVIALDDENIIEMEIEIKSDSGAIIFTDKEDVIENHSYKYIGDFYLSGLTKKNQDDIIYRFQK